LRLDGRVAYVTGSTRGIGRAVAATLAEAGAAVVVNGFQEPGAPERYAAELRDRYGTDCIGISADQRDPDAINARETVLVSSGSVDASERTGAAWPSGHAWPAL
jgi:NAD(P)-dependent dehydrogenase (short-subunit alcohol dehydrogenase family)